MFPSFLFSGENNKIMNLETYLRDLFKDLLERYPYTEVRLLILNALEEAVAEKAKEDAGVWLRDSKKVGVMVSDTG